MSRNEIAVKNPGLPGSACRIFLSDRLSIQQSSGCFGLQGRGTLLYVSELNLRAIGLSNSRIGLRDYVPARNPVPKIAFQQNPSGPETNF